MLRAQDQAHAEGHDYTKGSPHLRHDSLRLDIEASRASAEYLQHEFAGDERVSVVHDEGVNSSSTGPSGGTWPSSSAWSTTSPTTSRSSAS